MPKKKITPPVGTTLDPEAVPQFVPKEEPVVESDTLAAQETPTEETLVAKPAKTIARRGRKYASARSRVDKTKQYTIPEAIELVKSMSYAKFGGSLEAHMMMKDVGYSATFTYPHATGKTVKAAIVSDNVLANLDKGIIDFDILIARPEDMKRIAKYARLLGPKGLMPNPKNGTITPNPEAQKKALEGGSVTVKTERKAPLIHTIVGKVADPTTALQANIEALLAAFVGKVIKLHLTATMSPSVRVVIE